MNNDTNNIIDPMDILIKKEKYYKRNFISLMMEAFFFSFALAMFSLESVLPVYVSNLSKDPLFIAMITVTFYGISYSSTIFSCTIGVNAKSPKWISIIVCFFQRIGFLLIFLSTFMVSRSTEGALITFFISLALYSVSAGMSSPMFAQMVSTSIHRNVGSFYGSYSLVGSASGVIASLILTRFMSKYGFPFSFRYVFLLGLVFALIATLVVVIGLKEVTDDRVVENMKIKDIFPISKEILKTNLPFRKFTIIKVILGAAEFAIPYYIIVAGKLPNTPEGFVGIMATVFLISKMIGAVILGKFSDKYGAIFILRFSCICGILAAFMALNLSSWQVAFIMYSLLAIGFNGLFMSTSIACVTYSKGNKTPIYTATVSLLSAPVYILVAFGGASIVNLISYQAVFAIALIVYAIGLILTFTLKYNS